MDLTARLVYFNIVHLPGKLHANADALSRYLQAISSVAEKELILLGPHKAEFILQQSEDPVTSVLIAWCRKAQRPNLDEIVGESQELRYYWAPFDKLRMVDNVLCLQTAVKNGPELALRVVVQHALRQEILELAHGSAAEGHFGVQKTLKKLKQRFHWIKLSHDVKRWCEICPGCNRHKTQSRNHAALKPIYTGAPF